MITIMDRETVRRTITRLACEALENNNGTENLAIVGIRTRGVIVAQRIHEEIAKMEKTILPFGILDIALQRDDLLSGTCDAVFKGSEIDFNPDGKNILLCDDVMFTGRTVRAALAALNGMGRPAKVRLLCLVDRGHRELPFRADMVGKNVPTSSEERVVAHFVVFHNFLLCSY